MDASVLNYKVNDNVGEFLNKTKKLYINGQKVGENTFDKLLNIIIYLFFQNMP